MSHDQIVIVERSDIRLRHANSPQHYMTNSSITIDFANWLLKHL